MTLIQELGDVKIVRLKDVPGLPLELGALTVIVLPPVPGRGAQIVIHHDEIAANLRLLHVEPWDRDETASMLRGLLKAADMVRGS